jgi:hypothetical protein
MLVAVVALTALLSEPEFSAPLEVARFGRIIIEGNTDTPDRVILHLVEFRPGQIIQFGRVGRARAALRQCGVFQSNWWRGEGPTVELLPNEFDSQFLDVRVRVVERPGNWFVFGLTGIVEGAIISTLFLDPDPFLGELCWFVRRAAQGGRP